MTTFLLFACLLVGVRLTALGVTRQSFGYQLAGAFWLAAFVGLL